MKNVFDDSFIESFSNEENRKFKKLVEEIRKKAELEEIESETDEEE